MQAITPLDIIPNYEQHNPRVINLLQHQNMAGVAGRSGRKPSGWYRDLDDLLNRSFEVVMMALNDKSPCGKKLELKEKAELASRFLVKRVGEKIDLTVTHQVDSEQMQQLAMRLQQLRAQQNAIDVTHA